MLEIAGAVIVSSSALYVQGTGANLVFKDVTSAGFPQILLTSYDSEGFLGIAASNSPAGGNYVDRLVLGSNATATGITIIAASGTQDIRFNTPAGESVRFANTGNVGISTTMPVGTLTVASRAGMASSGYAFLVSSGNVNNSFGVHPNGHLSIYGDAPTLGTCLNGALTNASDTTGKISFTGANSSCAVVFNNVFDTTPVCVLTGAVATATEGAILSAEATTGFTVVPNTGAWDNGDVINYICLGSH
jgi:hypothetical protein